MVKMASVTSARDLTKQFKGKDIVKGKILVNIVSSERASHPSPAIMCNVLAKMGIDLGLFYNMCEEEKDLTNENDNDNDNE